MVENILNVVDESDKMYWNAEEVHRMSGKAVSAEDGRHHNRGGYRHGCGRPKGSTSPRGQRGVHQIRAYDDEWALIKEFMQLCRADIDKCKLTIELLKQNL